MSQPELDFARAGINANAAAQAAIKRAVEGANRAYPGWGYVALGFIKGYIERHGMGVRFTTEDVRIDALARGFHCPAEARAWGGIIKAAALSGMIKKSGIGRNKGRHGGYATVWEAV